MKVRLGVLVTAVVILSMGCGSSADSPDQAAVPSSSLSPDQMLRSACATVIGDSVASVLTGYAQSGAGGDRAFRDMAFRLGTESAEYAAVQSVISATVAQMPVIGLAGTVAATRPLVEQECSRLYPPPASTTSTIKTASTDTIPPVPASGSVFGRATAPSSPTEQCSFGPIQGIPAVECTIAAWRAGTIGTSKDSYISDTVKMALSRVTPPVSIEPSDCVVVSSKETSGGGEYSNNLVFSCTFDLDTNRTVTLTVNDASLGTQATVAAVEFGAR